jgi:hypothetical protein
VCVFFKNPLPPVVVHTPPLVDFEPTRCRFLPRFFRCCFARARRVKVLLNALLMSSVGASGGGLETFFLWGRWPSKNLT